MKQRYHGLNLFPYLTRSAWGKHGMTYSLCYILTLFLNGWGGINKYILCPRIQTYLFRISSIHVTYLCVHPKHSFPARWSQVDTCRLLSYQWRNDYDVTCLKCLDVRTTLGKQNTYLSLPCSGYNLTCYD